MSPRTSAARVPWFFPWLIELVIPLFASRSTSTRLLLAGLCGLALLAPGDAVRAELRGHGGFVTGIAVTPQGDRAVSASFDYSLILWNLENQEADQKSVDKGKRVSEGIDIGGRRTIKTKNKKKNHK